MRNFSRMLATLHLRADGRRQRATDPQRVLTTAATLRSRTLFVDSKFDEPVSTAPYEVITDPVPR